MHTKYDYKIVYYNYEVKDNIIICIDEIVEDSNNIKKILFIKENIVGFEETALVKINPDEIIVDKKNKLFYSYNNCLLTKSGILFFACKNSVIPTLKRVKSIGYKAFNWCGDMENELTKNIILSCNISKIDFMGLAITSTNEISITIPETVKYINEGAFMCRSIKNKIKIRFLGSPKLEIGVFGTENECTNINKSKYNLKDLPSILYTHSEDFLIECKKDTSVELYCKKYKLFYHLF